MFDTGAKKNAPLWGCVSFLELARRFHPPLRAASVRPWVGGFRRTNIRSDLL
jgi:hypothetical protein